MPSQSALSPIRSFRNTTSSSVRITSRRTSAVNFGPGQQHPTPPTDRSNACLLHSRVRSADATTAACRQSVGDCLLPVNAPAARDEHRGRRSGRPGIVRRRVTDSCSSSGDKGRANTCQRARLENGVVRTCVSQSLLTFRGGGGAALDNTEARQTRRLQVLSWSMQRWSAAFTATAAVAGVCSSSSVSSSNGYGRAKN